MLRLVERGGGAAFDDAAALHHQHAIAERGEEIGAGESEARRLKRGAGRQQSEDGAAGQRLAGPGLADDAEALAAHGEADAAHRLRVAEAQDEVAHLEQGRGHRCFGSSTSRRPSPSRLKPKLTTAMAMPGIAATHHWSSMYLRPAAIIAPHSGAGGCAPRPRKPNPAAMRMTPAMSRLTRTITEARHSGMMCRATMRPGEAPARRAAAMKSLRRSARVSARAMRA